MSRIEAIHIYRCALPVVGPPYRMALSSLTHLDTTLVEIVTDNGHIGYGETCPLGPTYAPAHAEGARAALAVIAPHLIGLPVETRTIARRMDAALAGHDYAKAAVDTALWDLLGKITGLRVCDLLGGATGPDVPSYYAIGIDTPDNVARVVREKQREGYTQLQIKIGGRGIDEEIAVIRMAFEARDPTTRIALDANRSLTTRDAILLSRACADLDFVLEQPCDSYDEIASLKGRIAHPLYLDECATGVNVVLRAIAEGVADGFGMKTTRVGGLSAMQTIRDICHVSRRPMSCDDSWGGDIIAAACVHIGATVDPAFLEGVWIADSYIDGNYDPANPVRVRDGRIMVPTEPGLGVAPDRTDWQTVASYG